MMKCLFLFSLSLWFLLFGAYVPARRNIQSAASQARQEQADRLCPVVTVECPDTVGKPGLPIKFSAKLSGAGDAPSLTLSWSVSAGTIISGQNPTHISTPESTMDITVDTTGLNMGGPIVATAEVGGLDRSCSVAASCTTNLLPAIGDPRPIDEYGNIKFTDEQARLDNFAIELQGDPTSKGYIDCYGGRKGYRGEAKSRCERAKKYLVSRRGISADRLVLIDGGFRENLTVVLWTLPPNVQFTSSPTVSPSEVQFINRQHKQKKQAARSRRPTD